MSNNLTNYTKNNYIKLTSPQKKSLKKLMLLKEQATGKPFAENHDPRFTTKQDAVADAAEKYFNGLIEQHQGQSDPVKTPGDFADEEQDNDGMELVRNAWDHDRLSYQYKLNKFIKQAKDAKDALNRPNKGGKSRVFRKKSNKTKTKKVSHRNRRSRNIRHSRNSRAYERK